MTATVHQFNDANTPRQSAPPVLVPATDGGDGGNTHMPDMSERIAKLEGAFDGLKGAVEGLRHSHNMIAGLLGILFGVGFAVMIAFMVYLLQRVDNLPAEFERLNQTLSAAITASKQQAPQVILIPAPTIPAPQQPVTPPK